MLWLLFSVSADDKITWADGHQFKIKDISGQDLTAYYGEKSVPARKVLALVLKLNFRLNLLWYIYC